MPSSTGAKGCNLTDEMKNALKNSYMSRSIPKALACIGLLSSLIVINGCQNKQTTIKTTQSLQDQAIDRLRLRIEKLESKVSSRRSIHSSQNHLGKPLSPIKSITFRIGSKDDRLRIYWADGSNSDLPCTKEQSIWVCG